MLRLLCSVWIGMLLCLPVCGETVTLIDDFSRESNPDWLKADKAEIRFEKGMLSVDYPRYTPGDSAAWPRATRNVEAFDFTRFNGLRIDIENPTSQHQFLQLAFRDVGGSQGQLAFRFGPAERRTLTVRFGEASPSGSVDWSGVQLIDIMRTQPAVPMTWIVRRIELFTDQPQETIQAELADLHKRTAESLSKSKTLVTAAMEDQFSQTLKKWGDAIANSRGLFGKMEQCRTELTAIHGKLRGLLLRQQKSDPLLMWTVALGTPFRPGEALLQFEKPIGEVSVFTAKGQYEESIIRLTNLADEVLDLRTQFSSSNPSIASALSLRRNQCVRASDKSIVGDALTPLDGAGIVSIAPSETIELWLRVDTKHHDLAAGSHHADLQLIDARKGAESLIRLPISITVRDFDLASVKQQFKVQAWAELFAGRSFVVHKHLKQARDNLIDYGVNVLNLGPDEIPWPKLSPTGELAAAIDYSSHDEKLFFLCGKDKPLILYFMNLDDNNNANWGLRNDLKPGSEEWQRGLRNWLRDWTQHLRSLGVSTQSYALYFTDEPGPEELDRYRIIGRIVREIDPSIQIYINSAELDTNAAQNDELMSVTDIWQPDETVGFFADPNLLPSLKKYPGKQLWVYACRAGMRSRSANPHDYYRLMAWRAMRDGLTGIGYWSYCAAINEKEDLWDGTRESGSDAVLVYPGADGILSSVRWELVRQSVDDTKYVQLLRDAADKKPELRDRVNVLCGPQMLKVIEQRQNPAIVKTWRKDAGQVIEESAKTN